MMIVTVFVIICVISAAATALGWFFGRMTRDSDPRPGSTVLPGKSNSASPAEQGQADGSNVQAMAAGRQNEDAPSASDPTSQIVQELLQALKTDAVSLVYQPKLDVREQAFHSAEALFRWDSANARRISIGDLILAAEKHNAIRELTLWTLRKAVSDQLTLLDNGVNLKTYVNLSAKLISDSEFTLEAIDIIKSSSKQIGIEITETSVIRDTQVAIANLELYDMAGLDIAIDDYGTGLSSLHYLKRIPADELKIDREFIKDLTSSHRDPMIVRSTIDLAHALGLRVTAEGVDCPTKMALLKVMGCDLLQGFHIAKPMPLTELMEFLADKEGQKTLLNPDLSMLLGQGGAGQ